MALWLMVIGMAGELQLGLVSWCEPLATPSDWVSQLLLVLCDGCLSTGGLHSAGPGQGLLLPAGITSPGAWPGQVAACMHLGVTGCAAAAAGALGREGCLFMPLCWACSCVKGVAPCCCSLALLCWPAEKLAVAAAKAGVTMSIPIAWAMLASAAADSTVAERVGHTEARRAPLGLLGASTASSSGTLTTWDHTSEPTTTVSSTSSTSSGCSCSRSARKLPLLFTLPGRCLDSAAAVRAAGLPV
ncbi:hypothetical protein V8C86DRAFT_2761381 [Haematococcus lacustris]